MLANLKTAARDALPRRLQVPVKYWYSALRGSLEDEMALLPELARPGQRVADVGANRGTYAYRLHKLGARVEIFEPNPACVRVLEAWARHRSGVAVHPIALSHYAGSAPLYVPVNSAGIEHDASASIENTVGLQNREIEVRLRPLDSFGFLDLEFIKIDVEGHEASVLAGAEQTLRSSLPALLIEIEQRHNGVKPIASIFGSVEALGYCGFFLFHGRLMSITRFDLDRHQSCASLDHHCGSYVNNFLFLATTRLSAGHYGRLAGRIAR